MRRLISILVVLAMMLSMVLMVIPASAAAEPASDTPVEATVPDDYQPAAGSWEVNKKEDIYLAYYNPVHLTKDIVIPADYNVGKDLVGWESKNATLIKKPSVLCTCGRSVSIPPSQEISPTVKEDSSKSGFSLRNFSTTPSFSAGFKVQVEYTIIPSSLRYLAEAVRISSCTAGSSSVAVMSL